MVATQISFFSTLLEEDSHFGYIICFPTGLEPPTIDKALLRDYPPSSTNSRPYFQAGVVNVALEGCCFFFKTVGGFLKAPLKGVSVPELVPFIFHCWEGGAYC